eukprot:CAMPEP_0197551518 /NCGR_PEP_ID=MMETSP1320-20131121/4851_1 /TAXON_ID=91990 /ORGANISM="Bolidomonas sp., Strain RCC2347" /LENGTH=200 /DNA_ID=CAMNT_0043112023 /DNA_START=37 /DNA_END=639 /DNA_ORIENTATION=-
MAPTQRLLLGLGDGSLLANVDAVEELSQILLPDVGGLLDLGGGEGDEGEVVAGELDLVLDGGGADVLDTLAKLDLADPLLSQKVADLDGAAGDGDVDGEVGVDEAHLVHEAAGDADEHVVNVGHDGPHAGELLPRGEPDVEADGDLAVLTHELLQVHVNVLETLEEGAPGALHGDLTGLDLNLHALGDGDGARSENGLHC